MDIKLTFHLFFVVGGKVTAYCGDHNRGCAVFQIWSYLILLLNDLPLIVILFCGQFQGGHGPGKTGNLGLTFSRQRKHREFCCNTGKVLRHRENIFDWIHWCKKHVSLHIFSNFFSLALLGITSSFKAYCFYQYIYSPTFFLYYICYKVSNKHIQAVF